MNYYNQISNGYNELHGEEQLQKAEIILQNIFIKASDRILDIGAGTGIYDPLFNACREKTNLDPSEELLKQNHNAKTVNIKGEATFLPFKDNSFNIIISLSALHHVEDIDKAISEMKRVAKPKAQFALTLLKRSKNIDQWIKKLEENFNIKKKISEEKDMILLFTQN